MSLTLACGLTAATGAVPQNRVDDIIARNVQAKGGLEKLQAINTIKQTGTMTMNGKETKIVSYSRRPNMSRQEARVDGKTVVNAFDGTQAWMVNPWMGGDRPAVVADPQQLAMIKEQSLFDGLLMSLKEFGYTATAEGIDSVGDRNLIHLKLVAQNKQVRHVYLDSITYLDAKISTEQGQFKLDQELSDYRDVEGVKVPHLIRSFVNGAQQSELKVEKVEFNVKMGDELFRVPKGF